MVARACDPSTREVEAGGSAVQVTLSTGKFEASLGHEILSENQKVPQRPGAEPRGSTFSTFEVPSSRK